VGGPPPDEVLPGEVERSGEPGKCPAGRGRRSPAPAAGDNPRGGTTMYENDCDIEMFTSDELLAELGLDAYTIRVIRDEAKGEAEEFRRE